MSLVFRGLSRHLEVSWSQSAWYQNQVRQERCNLVLRGADWQTHYMPGTCNPAQWKTGCSQARSSGSVSPLAVAVVLTHALSVKLHRCWSVAFVFPAGIWCQLLMAGEESESAFCLASVWVARWVDVLLIVREWVSVWSIHLHVYVSPRTWWVSSLFTHCPDFL